MPLPQQVIEQLGREPESSQGWAAGALMFSGGILFLVAAVYLGMRFGYEPYLNSQVSQLQDQVSKASQSVSSNDQQQIVSFYSQIANLKSTLASHVYMSKFLSWIEKNTQANVYYQSLDLSAGNRVTLKGLAKAETDVNQQIAIFEASPEVANVAITNIATSQTSGGGIQFTLTLTMNPSVFSPTAL